jgi:ABC-type multidrug transport system permease subunit
MLTGTKIAIGVSLWSLVLLSFIVFYGVANYGKVPEFWTGLAATVSAFGVIIGWVYGSNERRKRSMYEREDNNE